MGQRPVLRRRRRRFHLRKTTSLLLALIVLAICWPAVKWLCLRLLHAETSYFGTVERAYEAQAILIRKEQLLLSPTSGKVELLVKEGTRVPRGAQLVRITNEDLKRRLTPKIQAAGAELEEHEEETRRSLAKARGEVEKSQLAVDNDTAKLKKQLAKRNYLAARQLEEIITQHAQKRKLAIEALSELEQQSAQRREELAARRQSLQRQLERAVTVISAKTPGVVSFKLDGMEERCQRTSYSALFAEDVQARALAVKAGGNVKVGGEVGKLIDNFQCQLALCLQAEEDFNEGQVIYVHLPTGLEKARVDQKLRRGDLTYLLCTLPNYKLEWNQLRSLKLTVAAERREGIVVAASALKRRSGKVGVWVRQGGHLVWKEVTVRFQTKELAVVDGLPAGQAVITNPRFLR